MNSRLASWRPVVLLSALVVYVGAAVLRWLSWPWRNGPRALAAGVVFVAADLIFLLLLTGFARLKLRALKQAAVLAEPYVTEDPPVTILVPVCDEPDDVLRPAFAALAGVDYSGRTLLVVENSRLPANSERVGALAANSGIPLLRAPNRGTKASALNTALEHVHDEFVLVLDADVVPRPEILRTMLPAIIGRDDIAFVQAPQRDQGVPGSYVGDNLLNMEAPFYHHVCEGMGAAGRVMSSGSNCLFRVEAIRLVGGWPEDTVTEDVAISLMMHSAGYRSAYVNQPVATGRAPADLRSFFRQRARYIKGLVELAGRLRHQIVGGGGSLSAGAVLDYATCCAYPLLGLACLATFCSAAIHVEPRFITGVSAWIGFVAAETVIAIDMPRRGFDLVRIIAGQGLNLLAVLGGFAALSGQIVRGTTAFQVTAKASPSLISARRHNPARTMAWILAGGVALVAVGVFSGGGLAGWIALHVVFAVTPAWVAMRG